MALEGEEISIQGGAGRGRLTKVGEKQLFDLGLRMREKYIRKLNFMTDKYDFNEMLYVLLLLLAKRPLTLSLI